MILMLTVNKEIVNFWLIMQKAILHCRPVALRYYIVRVYIMRGGGR